MQERNERGTGESGEAWTAPRGDEELKRSIMAMGDLLGALRQATGQLSLASNLYSAGAQRFIALAGRGGASELRLAVIAKALDLRTSEASLQRFLTDPGLESAG